MKEGLKIKSVEHLIELLEESEEGVGEFYILLNGSLRSSKFISYDGEIFYLLDLMTSTEEELTLKELLDPNITNFKEAIDKGALYAYN